MNCKFHACALAMLLLAACTTKPAEQVLLGTLERERIAVVADASERIVRIDVAEGAQVRAGDPILSLDPRRSDARLEQAMAEARLAGAALTELRSGTRIETIDAARATLAGTSAIVTNAKNERDRIAEIHQRGMIAVSAFDRADMELRNAQAQRDAARARLAELLKGTRIEDIEQAEAALAGAEAAVEQFELTRSRYDVVAPRDAQVDALPFKLGDQPAAGAIVVSLLAGPTYARVYVPASQRQKIQLGTQCMVSITGYAETYNATLRSIRSDPAFTPYFALTGDDASRLAYRAELVLDDKNAATLPAGLPVQAQCISHAAEAGR